MTRIVIDPGHGGKSAMGGSSPFGARGPDGTLETAVNYALAERVQRLIGPNATLTRGGSENRSLGSRAALAREQGAEVFLSLHAHGHTGPNEAWVHTRASDRSLALAETLSRRMSGRFGARQLVQRGDLAVLHPSWHAPSTAACLLETNALAPDGRNLDQLARSIAEAVRDYSGDERFGRGAAARVLDGEVSGESTQCAVWNNEDEFLQACAAVEGLFANETGAVTAQALNFFPSYSPLSAAQIATARTVFGSSIDYGNVYITDMSGLGGRPFTIYVPIRGIQVINAGTLTPSTSTLIHELAHVWQSQHASNPRAFMSNSVASQALALASNLANGSTSAHYPFSAYAYMPGRRFADYAAEQIANQVENSEAAIVAHVAGVATGTTDPDNDLSLGTTRVEDVRVSGVHP